MFSNPASNEGCTRVRNKAAKVLMLTQFIAKFVNYFKLFIITNDKDSYLYVDIRYSNS